MIGAWRWALALLVVVGHLYSPWWPASFGVFSFYIISGFLMALIMNERYGHTNGGIGLFWKNRVLRIFPPYYAACGVSILVLAIVPSTYVVALNDKLIFPHTWFEWVTNIEILGLGEVSHRSSLVPPAWSLSIELVYYAVISFWAWKSRTRARMFLAAGLLYVGVVHALVEDDWWYRYFSVGAGALPFAVGVNIYFERRRIWSLVHRLSQGHPLPVVLFIYLGVFAAAWELGHVRSTFFYLNIVSTSLLLPVLWVTKISALQPVDGFLGDLSYPTYLLHWQVGILVVFLSRLPFKSPASFAISTGLVTGLSILEARYVSGRLERMRSRNKARLSALATKSPG